MTRPFAHTVALVAAVLITTVSFAATIAVPAAPGTLVSTRLA